MKPVKHEKRTQPPGKDHAAIRLDVIKTICDARARIGMYAGNKDTILKEADAFYAWIVEEK